MATKRASGRGRGRKEIRAAFATIALAVLFAGASVSRSDEAGQGAWRFSLGSAAQAANYACEWPPQDEPDGDGDECNPTFLQNIDPPKNLGGKSSADCNICSTKAGDPIDYTIGSEFESETDYRSGGPFPLALNRFYNSADAGAVHEFGAKWHGSYSRSIASVSATVATATRDDGRVFTFRLANGVWKPDADVNSKLTQSASGWVYVTGLDETETYDANGRLATVAARSGLTQRLAYDGLGRLISASDPFGRTLRLTYLSSSNSLISQVKAPDGGITAYGYDTSSNLTSVTHPDKTIRKYVYENAAYPHNLTGIVDELGVRFASFAYDAQGRAKSSQHAGGVDLYSVDYTYQKLGAIAVTNPLGAQTIYRLEGVNGTAKEDNSQILCVCQGGAVGQVTTYYDANGNIVKELDANGNTTAWTYDTARNLETSRTVAVGTPQAATTSILWHPNFRLPTQIAEPGRTTSFVYDARGNPLTKTLTSGTLTSVWSFTYNSAGQILTAKDPRGNVTVFAYDAWGNLAGVTNALGQATLFSSYDANGRPLAIQDPNGALTSLTYNFRGEIVTRTEGAWVTAYANDAAGQLTRVTRPDGSYLAYTYDAAHRLVRVTDALGGALVYTLDAAGNPVTEQVFDANKALLRTHNRLFDGMGRVYQQQGSGPQRWQLYYDKNNNLTNVSQPAGPTIIRTFDPLDRLIQTTSSSGGGAASATISTAG